MSALPLVDPATATGPVAHLLAAVQRGPGVTPNMTKAMANSPALLKGYLELSGALGRECRARPPGSGSRSPSHRPNACSYCLSAHSYLAEHVTHLSAEDIAQARKATSADPKTTALARLRHGRQRQPRRSRPARPDTVRAAGATDEEIAEAIGHVALNVLTDYFNKAVDVDIDFPDVPA